jgi:formamidopyrimidine-DNA glycosylase
VQKVDSVGKFIYWEFSNQTYLFSTLGMTGGWELEASTNDRAIFTFGGLGLYYSDPRNFGTFKFGCSEADFKKKLASLGPDLITQDCVPQVLSLLHKSKDKTLPELLMDQSYFAGVGNYLKSEILYRSKLSPHRKLKSLSQEELNTLVNTALATIRAFWDTKGDSLSGVYGSDELKVVYKKSIDPLGNKVVSEETLDKRTTYWVPGVQK